MDISVYLEPVAALVSDELPLGSHPRLGHSMLIYQEDTPFPELEGIRIALIGVPDERGVVNNAGCATGADEIRRYLYKLFPGAWTSGIADSTLR